MTPQPPAGWYGTEQSGVLRWWDGAGWTDHLQRDESLIGSPPVERDGRHADPAALAVTVIPCTGARVGIPSVPGAWCTTGRAPDGCIEIENTAEMMRLGGRVIGGSPSTSRVDGVAEVLVTADWLVAYVLEGVAGGQPFSERQTLAAVVLSAPMSRLIAVFVAVKRRRVGGSVGAAIVFEFADESSVAIIRPDRIEGGRLTKVSDCRQVAGHVAHAVAQRRGCPSPQWLEVDGGERLELPFGVVGAAAIKESQGASAPHLDQTAAASSSIATPAGWYPDPNGSDQQRYWDGQRWTEHMLGRS